MSLCSDKKIPAFYCRDCVISYPPAKRICICSLDRTVILSIIRYTTASEYSSKLRFSEEISFRIFLCFSSTAFRLSSEGSNSLQFSFSFRISFPICSNFRSAISFPSPLEIQLPGPLNALKKPLIRLVKGTVVEKVLRDHNVLKDGMLE